MNENPYAAPLTRHLAPGPEQTSDTWPPTIQVMRSLWSARGWLYLLSWLTFAVSLLMFIGLIAMPLVARVSYEPEFVFERVSIGLVIVLAAAIWLLRLSGRFRELAKVLDRGLVSNVDDALNDSLQTLSSVAFSSAVGVVLTLIFAYRFALWIIGGLFLGGSDIFSVAFLVHHLFLMAVFCAALTWIVHTGRRAIVGLFRVVAAPRQSPITQVSDVSPTSTTTRQSRVWSRVCFGLWLGFCAFLYMILTEAL